MVGSLSRNVGPFAGLITLNVPSSRLEASTPEVGDPRPFHGWSTVSAGDAVDCVRLDLELVPSVSWSQQCRGRRVSRRSEKVSRVSLDLEWVSKSNCWAVYWLD